MNSEHSSLNLTAPIISEFLEATGKSRQTSPNPCIAASEIQVNENFSEFYNLLLSMNTDLNERALPVACSLIDEQDGILFSLAEKLAQIFQNPSICSLHSPFLSSTCHQLFEAFKTETSLLERLFKEHVLDADKLKQVDGLLTRVHYQRAHLELCAMELSLLSQSQQSFQPVARLLIEKQPFPMIFYKDQLVKNGITAKIIVTGSQNYHTSVGPVTSTLLCENVPVSLESADNQIVNGEVNFTCKFACGTRKRLATIKLSTAVQMGPFSISVSDESKPLIVIANENQWEYSAQKLLRKDAFGDANEISWPQFINTLQKYFIGFTHQSLDSPQRPLSPLDIQYIHARYFQQKDTVSQKQFDAFWKIFGQIMFVLNHRKPICDMWIKGLIYGFIRRDSADALVSRHEHGTFVIRFSEYYPGQFTIASRELVDCNIKVSHYLFHADHLCSEWVLECDKFSQVLQIKDPLNFSFNLVDKFTAFPHANRRPSFARYLPPVTFFA